MPTSSEICFALVSHVMCRLSAAARKLSQQCCVNITPPCPRPCKHDVVPPLYIPNIVRSSCNVVTETAFPLHPFPFTNVAARYRVPLPMKGPTRQRLCPPSPRSSSGRFADVPSDVPGAPLECDALVNICAGEEAIVLPTSTGAPTGLS